MKNNDFIVGYTTGVFDLFHVGHLNILKKSKAQCDILIVGVSTDELVIKYKHKKPIIPFNQRIKILKSIKYVDKVIPQKNLNKVESWKKLKFNIMFHGDDILKNKKRYFNQKKVTKYGVKIVYFPYSKITSSTKIISKLKNTKN